MKLDASFVTHSVEIGSLLKQIDHDIWRLSYHCHTEREVTFQIQTIKRRCRKMLQTLDHMDFAATKPDGLHQVA